jgi:hypothetical protein
LLIVPILKLRPFFLCRILLPAENAFYIFFLISICQ